ncbi:MAG: hypothetical protein QME76_05395 [Bacillota bacterium]|nr:hypothetical protein [Bacillota bacterium]
MQIGESEAHFLAFSKAVLDEEKREKPEMDVFEFEIPVKKLRRAGFREDELQRVAQSLELKGLVKLHFNHRDELKRLRLRPRALDTLEEYLAANAGGRGMVAAPAEAGDPAAQARALARRIAQAARADRDWSALHALAENILQEETAGDRLTLLEHLDVLVQQAALTGDDRRPSVIDTLARQVEALLPVGGEARRAWDTFKSKL